MMTLNSSSPKPVQESYHPSKSDSNPVSHSGFSFGDLINANFILRIGTEENNICLY